ncbi:MAG: tetratricopeptide (TPR) repeat protein [Nitrospinales bacterium]
MKQGILFVKPRDYFYEWFAHSTCFFLILIPGCFYLPTLVPSIGFGDTPEFVDTAFALGISHPAGFPTYNLIAKAITFFPLGSIAFRINFFSTLFACMTLVVLYLAANKILEICFPESNPKSREWPALFPPALLAFSFPFWSNSLVAEVYTLHAFFTGLIIYLLLLWKAGNDSRFLFLAALCFGLSAGNHGTVAFYLPAILILFLAWEKNKKIKNLGLTTLFFLIGFSVYLYLPIRSMAEPIIDWGNPETLQNFFDQVTDRRHSEFHFSKLRAYSAEGNFIPVSSFWDQVLSIASKAGFVFSRLINDLALQFTWVMVIGFLGGAILCARKNLPLFIFLFLIVAPNAAFFVGWRGESYFPSYIVACLWAALFFYWLLYERLFSSTNETPSLKKAAQLKKTVRFSICAISGACVLWLMISNYIKVDRSGSYFGESLLKKELLSVDDEGVLVAENSWFNMAYFLDVMRLRDDVALVKAADFLEADPASYLTPKRYPQLELPDREKHRFDSREFAFSYMIEFFTKNAKTRPVLIEQNWALFERLPLAEKLLPHRNLLLKFPSGKNDSSTLAHSIDGFNQYKKWLEEDLKKPGLQRESKWIRKVIRYLSSFADYFHSTQRYEDEREVLKVIYDFLGQRGADWHLKMVDNLILDGKKKEARRLWEKMRESFPDKFQTFLAEGLLLKSEENYLAAIQSFNRASNVEPDTFRPYMENCYVWIASGNIEKTVLALNLANKKMKTLKDFKRIEDVKQFLETTH